MTPLTVIKNATDIGPALADHRMWSVCVEDRRSIMDGERIDHARDALRRRLEHMGLPVISTYAEPACGHDLSSVGDPWFHVTQDCDQHYPIAYVRTPARDLGSAHVAVRSVVSREGVAA